MTRPGRKPGQKIGPIGLHPNGLAHRILLASIALRGANTYQILNWIGNEYDEYPEKRHIDVVICAMTKGDWITREHVTCPHCGKRESVYTASEKGRSFLER